MAGFDTYAKSLLHFDGADASTTFTDESSKVWTAAGNAQIDTAQYKFGGASGLFDGTGDYISTPNSADFAFGSGDFTIDMWVKKSANATFYRIIGQSDNVPTLSTREIEMDIDTSNKLIVTFFHTGGGAGYVALTSDGTIDTNWHHIMGGRNGNSGLLSIDGTIKTVDLTGLTLNTPSQPFVVGRLGAYTSQAYSGGIDEFRLSKGIARWTSNFTPPTAAYDVGGGQVIWWSN